MHGSAERRLIAGADAWLLEQTKEIHEANRRVRREGFTPSYGSHAAFVSADPPSSDLRPDPQAPWAHDHPRTWRPSRRRPGRATLPPNGSQRAVVRGHHLLRSWEGSLYLGAVSGPLQPADRGWSMATHLRTELVLEALWMALARRQPEEGLIPHSDQGSQGGFNWSSQRSMRRSCDGHALGSHRPVGP
jgi:transposase InsO family protein